MTAEIVVVLGRGGGRGRGRGRDRNGNGKKADDRRRARIIDGELLLLLT